MGTRGKENWDLGSAFGIHAFVLVYKLSTLDKDGWKFRFEWQLASDQLVEMIWCQSFAADDPNNNDEAWYNGLADPKVFIESFVMQSCDSTPDGTQKLNISYSV